MKEIYSVNNPYIKELSKLKEKKYRDANQKYLVEGFHLIEMAKDDLIEIITTNVEYITDNIKNIPFIITSPEVIKKLSQTKAPQPIIGVCRYKKNDMILNNKILLLDNIQDPGNIGTLFRSSLAFGIDTVIVSMDTVDIYNDKVIRGSQGAIFEQRIIRMDILEAIKLIKEKNITIFGTSLINGISLNDIKKESKFAIILGNEGNGIRKDILSKTDINITIPMTDKIESLNVGVAGSIIMHYFY